MLMPLGGLGGGAGRRRRGGRAKAFLCCYSMEVRVKESSNVLS